MTEQHPARCSTTRASPRRSASLRPPVVTMIKTALSPTPLIVGLYRTVQPDGRRPKGNAAQQQAPDHVRLPVDVQVEAVEGHDDDDQDRDRQGEHARESGRCKPADHKSDQAVRDDGAHHVAAWKAVAEPIPYEDVGHAGPVPMRQGTWRPGMKEQLLVHQLGHDAAAESTDGERVGPESAPQ